MIKWKRSGLLVARQILNNEICGRTGASERKTCARMRENGERSQPETKKSTRDTATKFERDGGILV